ncbi:MAG: MoaD/ThiS family protein [Candidatus Hodarchaeota archaeon]
MASLKVEFLSSLAKITDTKEITIDIGEKSTIKDLLENLKERFGKEFEGRFYTNGKLNSYIIILLNGNDVRNAKFINTELKEGDNILFLPAIAGG